MSLPVGAVVGMIGANPSSPPAGWLYCNGSTFDGVKYPELAAILNNNTLPNLVGLSLIGASVPGTGSPYPPSWLGAAGGNQQNANGTYGNGTHTMALEEMPSHQHFGFGEGYDNWWPFGQIGSGSYPGSNGGRDGDNYYYGTTFNGGVLQNANSVQPNNAFGLIQPSYAIYFFIKAMSDV